MTNAQPSNRAETPRSCPTCTGEDRDNRSRWLPIEGGAICRECPDPWHDAAPAAATPHPDTDICRECGEMRCHDNHFREHARGTVFHDFTPERRIEGAPTPQEHHKPCGSPTCVACSFKHVPLPYPHSSLIYMDLSVRCGFCKQRACWRYEVESDEIVFTHECVPSAPTPAPAKELQMLSKNAIAREFFDDGYDNLPDSKKALIDARFDQLSRAAAPSAPVERIETMPMKPRDVAWKSERCAKEFTMRNGRKGICDSYLGHFGLHSMLLHTSELHAAPSGAEEATPPNCDKNMGNDVLIIPCDLKKGHFGPCERNTWPVTESEQRLAVQKDAAMELFAVASEAYGYLSSLHRDAPKHSGAANIAPRLKEALDAFKAKPEYPKPCGICEGVIQSKDDLDWHGYGNCRDIPEPIMKQMAEAVPEPRPETPREEKQ